MHSAAGRKNRRSLMTLGIKLLAVRLALAVVGGLRREEGQGLTEYALILALVAVVAIAALTLLGGRVTRVITSAASSI